MKKNIITGAGIVASSVGVVLGLGFGFYALFGFMTYLISDPFNWIKDPSPSLSTVPEQPDIVKCRNDGGYAITSAWDGRFKSCQFPNPTQQ